MCWIDRPGYSGAVIKEDGKLISLDFTEINQRLDRLDKKTWGQLCCEKGYLDDARTTTPDILETG